MIGVPWIPVINTVSSWIIFSVVACSSVFFWIKSSNLLFCSCCVSFIFLSSSSIYDLHWFNTSALRDWICSIRSFALMAGAIDGGVDGAGDFLEIVVVVLLGVIIVGFGFFIGSNVCVMVVCFIVGGLNQALGLEGFFLDLGV